MSYSLDLRQKVVLYVECGHSRVSAAKIFGIGKSTVHRWILRKRESGTLNPLPHGGGFPSKINADDFQQYVADNPDKTLQEMGNFLEFLMKVSPTIYENMVMFIKKSSPLQRKKLKRSREISRRN